MTRAFRFGMATMTPPQSREWLRPCERAADQGYDIVLVPDHLGTVAPFSASVAIASATGMRVGTYVLNTGMYPNALLARDISSARALIGDGFELGLGTGYLHAEFAAAGLDPGTPHDRVNDLARALATITETPPDGPPTPVLVAGNGDRVLRLAAEHADIVGFLGLRYDPAAPGGQRPLTSEEFAGRVRSFESAAGARGQNMERNLAIRAVVITDDRAAALRTLSRTRFRLPVDLLDDLPILLVGSVTEIAGQLQSLRERHGISYFAVPDPYQDAFAPVIERLVGR